MGFKYYRSEPLTEKEKAYRRKSLGIKQRFAADQPQDTSVKQRDYLAPVKANFVPCKPRGRSGCRMSHEKRLLILQRAEKRVAFFNELGVRV
jgi:hypothetical protein